MSDKRRDWKYWKTIIRNWITLLILDVFIFIAVVLINLLPSIYDRVQKTFGLRSPVPIMFLEAFLIIIAASVAVYWAYLIDKIDRKKILFLSMAVWILGAIICTYATNFPVFVLGRIITAFGLGAQMPASYSIMADIIPARYWSTLFGSLALLVSISNAAGNFFSGFLAPMNIWGLGWKFPFAFLSLLSIICFALLLIIKLPNRGASAIEEFNAELGDQVRRGSASYNYTIKKNDLLPLWKIDCNRYMLYACFFAVIPASVMVSFLIYYMVTYPFASFPDAIRTQTGTLFAGMAGLGYLVGVLLLGPLFDYLHIKHSTARAKFTYWGLLVAIPLLIAAFLCIEPIDYNSLGLTIDANDPSFDLGKYATIMWSIFGQHPKYVAYFVLFLIGGIAAAPMAINRTPVILEINLPEHQGSSQAILNFSDQIGRGVSLIFLAFQFIIFQWLGISIFYVLITSVLFYLFPFFWWRKIAQKMGCEQDKKVEVLTVRANGMKKPSC